MQLRTLLVSLFMTSAAAFAASPIAARPAPPLDIVDSAGKHFVLSSYRGKVVVVQFLLTTCSHCQAFSKLLDRLQAEYGPKGFQAVGAAVNEATNEMARDYHANIAPAFPIAAVPHDLFLSFMGVSVMARPGFPQIAVTDRQGQIREQSSSDMNAAQPLQDEAHLRALIEKLLAEGASR